jgi:hypothetical protein
MRLVATLEEGNHPTVVDNAVCYSLQSSHITMMNIGKPASQKENEKARRS